MKIRALTAACAVAVLPLSGCGILESNDPREGASSKVSVTSSDSACKQSASTAKSGRLEFEVKNTGNKVTEFYLYGEDGKRIVGEVENIGPGLTRELVITAQPGKYFSACKPGMAGDGIRAAFTVTGKKVEENATSSKASATAAITRYTAYVHSQADQLLDYTKAFAAAYRSGDDTTARKLYPDARRCWESIEPVAESFGDLDPKMDLREADLGAGQRWTGWHRIEKDLWPPAGNKALTTAERVALVEDLVKNTQTLYERTEHLELTLTQISNGAKELLDEVSTTKITGEEEAWSHTDLYDVQANLDGAHEAFESLEPLLKADNAELIEKIDAGFDAVNAELAKYRSGDGFVSYQKVTDPQRKRLSDAVAGLAEPLSQMTGVLTS